MANFKLWASVPVLAVTLASCGPNGEYAGFDLSNFDPDMRAGSMNTTQAAAAAQPRPQPDARGVISYPGYQVAIARQGDSVSSIASRLGVNAAQVAQYNAIDPNLTLSPGAVVALPMRVAGGTPATITTRTPVAGQQVTDPFAGQGVKSSVLPPAGAAAATTTTTTAAPQPRQHVVTTGETAWSIARKYNVSVSDLAQWNGLTGDMAVRVGQRLLVPVAGAPMPQTTAAATTTNAPGTASATPQPPSASEPLPNEKTAPANQPVATPAAPNLGQTRTAASGSGKFRMPVNGAIARTYSKGKNEGIDITAAPGTSVVAAGSGTVAAITRDTGQKPIIVVRHDNNLMTVYTGIDDVTVTKGQQVQAGTALGKARSEGLVHFEVRNGFESVDPEKYLN